MFLQLLILATLASLCASRSAAECPEGWNEFEGDNCYKVFPEKATISEAKERCKAESAKLVQIQSEEENEFVGELLESSGAGPSIWLGMELVRDKKSGKVVRAHWLDGSIVKFFADPVNATDEVPWAPNSLKPEGNCVWTHLKKTWITRKCTEQQKYMCEKKACEEGWTVFGGNCYKVFPEEVTVEEAKKRCLFEASELVAIKDEDENNFVRKQLEASQADSVWLGMELDRLNGSGRAVGAQWVDGAPVLWGNPAKAGDKFPWAVGGATQKAKRAAKSPEGDKAEAAHSDKSPEGKLDAANANSTKLPEGKQNNSTKSAAQIKADKKMAAKLAAQIKADKEAADKWAAKVKADKEKAAKLAAAWEAKLAKIKADEEKAAKKALPPGTAICVGMQSSGNWVVHKCEEKHKYMCEH